MAIELGTGYVSIVPSARNMGADLRRELTGPARTAAREAGQAIETELNQATQRGGRTAGQNITQLLGSAAVLAGINRVRDAASGLQQAVGGTAAVFGDAAAEIDSFVESAAETVGLSERAARETTSQIGALLKGFGYEASAAADEAINLTQVGADLAATFGGTTAEAVDALGAALRGETDPIERFGISLRAAGIEAKAVELGLADANGEVDAHGRAQAALALILEQSGGALGQFARESESAAGQAQIAAARSENAAADFGEAILPLYARAAEVVGILAEAFAGLPEPVQTGLLAVAGAAAVAGPLGRLGDLAQTVGISFRNAEGGLTKFGKAGIALAGIALAATLYEIAQASNQVSVDIEEASRATTEELMRQFEAVDQLPDRFGGASQGLQVFTQLAREAPGAALELREALAATGEDVSELDAILEAEADAQARSNQRAEEGDEALAALASGTDDAAVATEDLTAVTEGLADMALTAAEAVRTLYGETLTATQADVAYQESIDELTASIEENGASLDSNTEQGRANIRAAIDSGEAVADLIALRLEETGSVDEARAAGDLYVQNLRDQLLAAGLTEEQVAGLIDTMNLTPDDITTLIQQVGAEEAEARTGEFQAALERLPEEEQTEIQALIDQGRFSEAESRLATLARPRTVRLNADIDESLFVVLASARAKGGDVKRGRPYVVGEEGWELIVPDFDGTVIPHEASRSMVSNLHAGVGIPGDGAAMPIAQFGDVYLGDRVDIDLLARDLLFLLRPVF